MSNPIVVLDTVVFIRALLNPYGIWGQIVFTSFHAYRLVMSRQTTRELIAVLVREEFRAAAPHITEIDISALLSLIARAELVEPVRVEEISRDRKDNPFLAVARAAGADYLVTEDEDLLVLHSHRGTQIVRGAEFSTILKEEGKGA
jgi:uncharacterized protein